MKRFYKNHREYFIDHYHKRSNAESVFSMMKRKSGTMIQIGAILVDPGFESDPIVTYEVCPQNCTFCIDSCPQKALDGKTVNQQLCRDLSIVKMEKGYILKTCNVCRRICPNALKIK